MALAVLCLAALAVAPQSAVAFSTIPEPSAGWHGRAVARPHDPIVMPSATRSPLRGWGAGPVRRGTGLETAKGSSRVREVQRRLLRLGYRPGRADGRFGSRTEASVRWFQIKHGIPAVGVVGAGTLRHLRERTAPRATAAEPGSRIPEPSGLKPAQSPLPLAPRPAGSTPSQEWAWPVGLLAAGLSVAGILGARRRRRKPLIVPVTWPLWAEGRRHADATGHFAGTVQAVAVPRQGGREATHYLVADPESPEPFWVTPEELDGLNPPPAEEPATTTEDGPLAIGYVQVPAGSDVTTDDAFRERVAAIETECLKRGWRLDQVVRETEPSTGSRGERRGLVHALEGIADAEAGAFVVAELQHLTRSVSELATLLEWFSDSEATLVALDVGLDTATSAGAVTQRAMASVGAWERERQLSPEQSDMLERMVRMRAEGIPIEEIARSLTAEPQLAGQRRAAEVHSLADARYARRRPVDRGPRRGRSA